MKNVVSQESWSFNRGLSQEGDYHSILNGASMTDKFTEGAQRRVTYDAIGVPSPFAPLSLITQLTTSQSPIP